MDDAGAILFALLCTVAFMRVLYLVARHYDSIEWNDGKCQHGFVWRCFDVDSSGARGYKAGFIETCCVCWISTSVDRC